MAKQKKPQISPPAPFENTTVQEVTDTPDIQALRAYSPSTATLAPTLKARLDLSRSQVKDRYGAYSGLPAGARTMARDEALREVDATEALALAEGDERAQALKLAQLETLANLTRGQKSKQSGFNTSVIQPQGSNLAGAAIGGGATVAAAAIPAIIA